jgi:hypothetical protein
VKFHRVSIFLPEPFGALILVYAVLMQPVATTTPCSHRKAAELDRSDPEISRSSGAQPGASSHPESARTLPRKRQ